MSKLYTVTTPDRLAVTASGRPSITAAGVLMFVPEEGAEPTVAFAPQGWLQLSEDEGPREGDGREDAELTADDLLNFQVGAKFVDNEGDTWTRTDRGVVLAEDLADGHTSPEAQDVLRMYEPYRGVA